MLSQVPKLFIHVVLAYRGCSFYEHPSANLIGIFRAVKTVIEKGKHSLVLVLVQLPCR